MSVRKYVLLNEANGKPLGEITFNGKFTFELYDGVDIEYWNRIGFLRLESNNRKVESKDLFKHLNARLPITLRPRSNHEKLEYIEKTGLRVASDNFVLLPVPSP